VEGSGGTVLRFYSWSPATLSLGYFQSLADRASHAASRSLSVVRRASGGGAIVHDRELTYSFAAPVRSRFGRDVGHLVCLFHQALVDALSDWRIPARRCTRPVILKSEPFLCFRRRAENDVLLGDAKIAGSAQRRHRQAVLQHGSVLLRKSAFAGELPGIGELAGASPSAGELQTAWTEVLAQRLGLRLVSSQLSPAELERSDWWAANRFNASAWNGKR
jgi:lipoate-protein ligase A